jgi:hypothetical protein
MLNIEVEEEPVEPDWLSEILKQCVEDAIKAKVTRVQTVEVIDGRKAS